VIVAEPDVGQVVQDVLAVEQTNRDAFAPLDRGRGGYAHVDVFARDLAPDATVLRQALLRDVEPGHDLHTRDDRGNELAGCPSGLIQHTVDAIADHDVLLARLDVDVAGPLFDGVEHQRVDPADDGRLVVDVEDVHQLLGRAHLVLALALAQSARVLPAPVHLVDGVQDLAAGDQQGDKVAAHHAAQVVQPAHVERVGGGHRDGGSLLLDRQQTVLLGERDGYQAGQLGVDLLDVEVGRERDAELGAECAQHVFLAHGTRLL
jgi:hypothetical protein